MTDIGLFRALAFERISGRHVVFTDNGLLSRLASASVVVLGVWSDAPPDTLRRHFEAVVAFTYFMDDGQRREMPCPEVELLAIPAPPPQINVAPVSVCFEIVRPHEIFRVHADARRMEFHPRGDWPSLTIELWAVGLSVANQVVRFW